MRSCANLCHMETYTTVQISLPSTNTVTAVMGRRGPSSCIHHYAAEHRPEMRLCGVSEPY